MADYKELCNALRHCSTGNCTPCPWYLTICIKEKIGDVAVDAIEALQAENKRLKKERDAAVKDMNHIASTIEKYSFLLAKDGDTVSSLNLGRCDVCNHADCDDDTCRFEWRGAQENTRGKDKVCL